MAAYYIYEVILNFSSKDTTAGMAAVIGVLGGWACGSL